MKDFKNKEVKIGDSVIFNHPNARVLDSSLVLDITPDGIVVNCHFFENKMTEVVIPEKQFVITVQN